MSNSESNVAVVPFPVARTRMPAAVPGLALALSVSFAAYGLAQIEARLLGHAIIEALVLAILVGMAVRAVWPYGERWTPGVRVAAKPALECAIVGLGASVNLPAIFRAGPALLVGIAVTVALIISFSYGISRTLGLSHKMSLLVACGNSICGNAAIAAVAPVIDAHPRDIVSSIAFTNLLGVILVLGLPPLGHAIGLSLYQYGVVAGLSVYAVPQVVAATFPVSQLSGQVGTLVKLMRVLLLGPVVFVLALSHRSAAAPRKRLSLQRYVPWFLFGFLALGVARSAGFIPDQVADPIHTATTGLMVLAMAGMGLGVDLRGLASAGARVTMAVGASLVALIGASFVLLHVLAIR